MSRPRGRPRDVLQPALLAKVFGVPAAVVARRAGGASRYGYPYVGPERCLGGWSRAVTPVSAHEPKGCEP